MANDRLEILKSLAERNPNDSFALYGLAMEYANTGNLDRAVVEFRQLIAANPKYAAAYYHCGQMLEKLGRLDEARDCYGRGVEITTEIGDLHTRSEIQAALDILG